MDKKAVGIFGVVIIAVVVVLIYWLISSSLADDECSKDTDCPSGYYCGSDLACHEFKVVEKTVVEYNLLGASIVVGIAIIIAAIIMRWKRPT